MKFFAHTVPPYSRISAYLCILALLQTLRHMIAITPMPILILSTYLLHLDVQTFRSLPHEDRKVTSPSLPPAPGKI